ncbi:MAG: hypothetical protein CMK76_07205 [Pseudomonadales bacterium]|nr:hypothetical protein [Pseudomonadales bacterium]
MTNRVVRTVVRAFQALQSMTLKTLTYGLPKLDNLLALLLLVVAASQLPGFEPLADMLPANIEALARSLRQLLALLKALEHWLQRRTTQPERSNNKHRPPVGFERASKQVDASPFTHEGESSMRSFTIPGLTLSPNEYYSHERPGGYRVLKRIPCDAEQYVLYNGTRDGKPIQIKAYGIASFHLEPAPKDWRIVVIYVCEDLPAGQRRQRGQLIHIRPCATGASG